MTDSETPLCLTRCGNAVDAANFSDELFSVCLLFPLRISLMSIDMAPTVRARDWLY
jgi:hypothetical protein